MARGGAEETFDCLLAKVGKLLSTSDWVTVVKVGDVHETDFILMLYSQDA